ncbi:HupE/UreJ family protein [Bradyrhizobium sp. HKCCYLS1011]|uniref:HupE/UreJ family protein n=1 Tax=Bradyrhizobium sp. HKCCYLS1011 TaxID=3420733 RepID=UPI003EBC2E34
MRRTLKHGLIATALLLAQAPAAEAHIVAIRLGDFYAGALHPFTDLQDVLLWLAMGLLAGSLGAMRGRWLVALFPLGLLAGLALGAKVGAIAANPAVDAVIAVVLGLLLAAGARVPTALLCVMAFALAALRGAANASDLAPNTDRLLFAGGLACAGYAAITLIMALTLAFGGPSDSSKDISKDSSKDWRGIALRALGGWIAAIGLMMAGLAFAS